MWRNGALRTCLMAWEKMRDTSIRQAFHGRPRYLRFDVKMDGAEPRLDHVDSMALWESRAFEDGSLSSLIREGASRAVASLFYFELADQMEYFDGHYQGQGHIWCSLGPKHSAFYVLIDYLRRTAARFYLNKEPIPYTLDDDSCFDAKGRFRVSVLLKVSEKFSIILR